MRLWEVPGSSSDVGKKEKNYFLRGETNKPMQMESIMDSQIHKWGATFQIVGRWLGPMTSYHSKL